VSTFLVRGRTDFLSYASLDPMKRPTQDAFDFDVAESIFREIGDPALAIERSVGPGHIEPSLSVEDLDQTLSTIKWIFLYLPGAAGIHCEIMLLSLFASAGQWPVNVMLGSFGIFIVLSFMALFGLGRLSDRRYFGVLAALLSSSILSAVAYSIFAAVFGNAYFVLAMLLTAPITIAFGELFRRYLDDHLPE